MEIEIKYLEWFNSSDCGVSSKTIMSILTGIPYRGYGVPADAADFGRCYRMLKLFPELRKRLDDVYYTYKPYQPFIDCWLQLERLYVELIEFSNLSEVEQRKMKRQKYFSDPRNEFWKLIKKIEFTSYYFNNLYPQGSDSSWSSKRKVDMF